MTYRIVESNRREETEENSLTQVVERLEKMIRTLEKSKKQNQAKGSGISHEYNEKDHLSDSVCVYTIEEVADLLKCKVETVNYYLYRTRELAYLKVGKEVRIIEDDLKKFVRNRRTPCIFDKEILS